MFGGEVVVTDTTESSGGSVSGAVTGEPACLLKAPGRKEMKAQTWAVAG